MVPEQASQDEARLRGTEKGPGDFGGFERAQDISGDGPEHGHTQEETATGLGRVWFAHRPPPPSQVRRIDLYTIFIVYLIIVLLANVVFCYHNLLLLYAVFYIVILQCIYY